MGMSAAERQKKYRRSRVLAGVDGLGERRLSMWVSLEAGLALERLARRDGVTLKVALEKLVLAKDRQNLAAMVANTPEWVEYFGGEVDVMQ